MKRRGSISVLSLLVMSVILITAVLLIYQTKIQSIISSSYNNKIQSNYLAESKLNLLLYDDKYYRQQLLPSIQNYLTNPNSKNAKTPIINIDKEDLDETDKINSIDIEYFFNSESKHMMGISSKSNYNGNENEIKAYGTLVNDLYHYGDGKVISKLNNKEIETIIDEIGENITIDNSKLPTYLTGMQFTDKDIVNIDYKDGIYYRLKYGQTTMDIKNDLFLIMKDKLYTNNPIKLHIGGINDNKKLFNLKGLLYIEGDLIISTEFQFTGILILKGGKIIVNYDKIPNFRGIILTDGDIDYSKSIETKSSYQNMCMYGIYLPDFIQPKIEVIKKY